MNTLAGIDTTKVYGEFEFNRDQVKGLKCDRWFIHVDLVNWLEEELNRMTDWNVIKILYAEVYHFEFNHIKCLEIYYKHSSNGSMAKFFDNEKCNYKMPWKGEMIYYTESDPELIEDVGELLRNNNLQKHLIKSYEMEFGFIFEQSVTVYEFKQNLNNVQKLEIDDIFYETCWFRNSVFISDDFLFLNVSEPPTIMKTEVLLPFHGQFLGDLDIQDILAVELANKDHRLPFYDRDLDHDIQRHLETRFPMLYANKELETYDASHITNSTILKYFLYKYGHCLKNVYITEKLYNYSLIRHEYNNLIFNSLQNNSLRVEVISPGDTTLYSLTFIATLRGWPFIELTDSEKTVRPVTRHIRLNYNMDFNLVDLNYIENLFESFSDSNYLTNFEILITNDPPAGLPILIHKLLDHIVRTRNINITVSLSALDKPISDSILNLFFNMPDNFQMEFKNITFHLLQIMEWFSKIVNNISVRIVDCRILLNECPIEIRLTKIKKLTFKDMNIDVHLPIRCRSVVFDNCYIIPSVWSALLSTTFSTVKFENMTVELYNIAPLQYQALYFSSCQIVSRQEDILLESESIIKSGRSSTVDFLNMDIDLDTLMKIADLTSLIRISNSHIQCLSNEFVDLYSNYPVKQNKMLFFDMSIEMKMLFKILYKFDDVTFVESRILFTDNFISEITIKLKNLNFTRIYVSEIINNLKYFQVVNPIVIENCRITNENIFEIWRSKRDQKLVIKGSHQINDNFYLEVIGMLYENEFDQLRTLDRLEFPFQNLIEIEWPRYYYALSYVDTWNEIQIRSVLVNDVTFKLEYVRDGQVVDPLFEQDQSNDSDISEVDYF